MPGQDGRAQRMPTSSRARPGQAASSPRRHELWHVPQGVPCLAPQQSADAPPGKGQPCL